MNLVTWDIDYIVWLFQSRVKLRIKCTLLCSYLCINENIPMFLLWLFLYGCREMNWCWVFFFFLLFLWWWYVFSTTGHNVDMQKIAHSFEGGINSESLAGPQIGSFSLSWNLKFVCFRLTVKNKTVGLN